MRNLLMTRSLQQLLEILHQAIPNMSLIASDFSFLPDVHIPGDRAPLVSTKVKYLTNWHNITCSHSCLLVILYFLKRNPILGMTIWWCKGYFLITSLVNLGKNADMDRNKFYCDLSALNYYFSAEKDTFEIALFYVHGSTLGS